MSERDLLSHWKELGCSCFKLMGNTNDALSDPLAVLVSGPRGEILDATTLSLWA